MVCEFITLSLSVKLIHCALVDNYGTSNMNSNHWVGSNSILKVVDENTLVYNTDNLFVVDVRISAQPNSSLSFTDDLFDS
jgi:hypothetical protein